MRKVYYVTIFVIILIVSFLGITYSFEYGNEDSTNFELIGPSNLYIDVNTKYIEYGVKVLYNNVDVTPNVKIDSSSVNTSKLGEYKVKYEYNNEHIYRNVIVIDKIKPVIELIGESEVYILLNNQYKEEGYTITDNYDNDLKDNVIVSGKVDTTKEGTYEITYTVYDNSGNKASVTRKVIVRKSKIILENEQMSKINEKPYDPTIYQNTITKNRFTTSGIYFSGYVKNNANKYQLKLKNKTNDIAYSYDMHSSKENYYTGDINLTPLANGTYDVYIVSTKEEPLMNKLDELSRIIKSKVGNKLITLNYDNDCVSITIEDFNYQYDIVIDPGHGGSDIGTSNGIINERDLNLQIAKYEKCRYESMGYKVYLLREENEYSNLLGNSSLEKLERIAITLGYYSVVGKVTYSIHHNGSKNTSDNGFEIIVSNQINNKDLSKEISLYNKYKELYKLQDDKIRLYSKDYYTKEIFDKTNGNVYSAKNYYDVIRIPFELFNTKNVIYEPIYITNANNVNWYYYNNNWIKVSELRIEEYVKYLGGTYNSDNKKCL